MRVSKSERRKERQEQAAVRQAEYDALSVEQKIARAEGRPGNSEKELRRLYALTN